MESWNQILEPEREPVLFGFAWKNTVCSSRAIQASTPSPILFQQGKLNQAKSQFPSSTNNRGIYGSNSGKLKPSKHTGTRLEKAKICR